MGRRLPTKQSGHKICIVCEGDEEYDYVSRLKELQVWSRQYSVKPKNAGSIDNIAAIYQDAYTNDNYEAVLIFCDTELAPYEQYNRLKGKLTELFGTEQRVPWRSFWGALSLRTKIKNRLLGSIWQRRRSLPKKFLCMMSPEDTAVWSLNLTDFRRRKAESPVSWLFSPNIPGRSTCQIFISRTREGFPLWRGIYTLGG